MQTLQPNLLAPINPFNYTTWGEAKDSGENELSGKVTPEHMIAFATGVPHAQPTQCLHLTHQKCKVAADAKMW